MRSALLVFITLATVALFSSTVPAANADTLLVSGQIEAVGNSVCAGAPCKELISFSFELAPAFVEDGGGLLPNFVLSSVNFSGTGALGNVSANVNGDLSPETPSETLGHIYTYDELGDEFDIPYSISATGTGYTFNGDQASFYACESTACINDFNTTGMPCLNLGCGTPLFNSLNFSVTTLTATPEPSSFSLLASGVLLLVLVSGTLMLCNRQECSPRFRCCSRCST
jgi:hypothetical protein